MKQAERLAPLEVGEPDKSMSGEVQPSQASSGLVLVSKGGVLSLRCGG